VDSNKAPFSNCQLKTCSREVWKKLAEVKKISTTTRTIEKRQTFSNILRSQTPNKWISKGGRKRIGTGGGKCLFEVFEVWLLVHKGQPLALSSPWKRPWSTSIIIHTIPVVLHYLVTTTPNQTYVCFLLRLFRSVRQKKRKKDGEGWDREKHRGAFH